MMQTNIMNGSIVFFNNNNPGDMSETKTPSGIAGQFGIVADVDPKGMRACVATLAGDKDHSVSIETEEGSLSLTFSWVSTDNVVPLPTELLQPTTTVIFPRLGEAYKEFKKTFG